MSAAENPEAAPQVVIRTESLDDRGATPALETLLFVGGVALLLGVVLGLVVALPMRRFAAPRTRSQFARQVVIRVSVIVFALLFALSAFMRGWQNGFAFLWSMQWQAWVLIAATVFTSWLVARRLAPLPTRRDVADVFD